jgi:hypothetical protein
MHLVTHALEFPLARGTFLFQRCGLLAEPLEFFLLAELALLLLHEVSLQYSDLSGQIIAVARRRLVLSAFLFQILGHFDSLIAPSARRIALSTLKLSERRDKPVALNTNRLYLFQQRLAILMQLGCLLGETIDFNLALLAQLFEVLFECAHLLVMVLLLRCYASVCDDEFGPSLVFFTLGLATPLFHLRPIGGESIPLLSNGFDIVARCFKLGTQRVALRT